MTQPIQRASGEYAVSVVMMWRCGRWCGVVLCRPPTGIQPKPAAGRCPQSAENNGDEACELPARPRPAPGRSRLPDGCPHSAEEDVDEAGKLPARPRPAPGRRRLPEWFQFPPQALAVSQTWGAKARINRGRASGLGLRT